jgi:hypothetical protein
MSESDRIRRRAATLLASSNSLRTASDKTSTFHAQCCPTSVTIVSILYEGSNYMPCHLPNSSGRQTMDYTITIIFSLPVTSVEIIPPAPFTLIVSGNTAYANLPAGTRCTDAVPSYVPITVLVDGQYVLTGTLVIPANT